MRGTKGYHSYRGRGTRRKIILAVVLVAVIAAAFAMMRIQQYVVYDETGRPQMQLPWKEEEEAPPLEDLELIIQEAEKSAPAPRARQLADQPLVSWAGLEAGSPFNAVAVTMKDSAGSVYFPSGTAVSGAGKALPGTAPALSALLADKKVHTIARFSCFLDPRAAHGDVEGKGLKNTGGFIFYDGNQKQWLDPGKPGARQYLCGLIRELAELGFDEILLTDLSYPTVGKLNKISYTGAGKNENLAAFLTEAAAVLEPYETILSVELPQKAVSGDPDAGLVLAEIAPKAERVYMPAAPEQTETLSAAVKAASADTLFVPELAAGTPEPLPEVCLLLP